MTNVYEELRQTIDVAGERLIAWEELARALTAQSEQAKLGPLHVADVLRVEMARVRLRELGVADV